MTSSITFGKLYNRLQELGFIQHEIEMYAKPRYVFEHRTIPNAMIVLPERDRDAEVEPFYMGSVLATLKAHRLVPECNPLMT